MIMLRPAGQDHISPSRLLAASAHLNAAAASSHAEVQ